MDNEGEPCLNDDRDGTWVSHGSSTIKCGNDQPFLSCQANTTMAECLADAYAGDSINWDNLNACCNLNLELKPTCLKNANLTRCIYKEEKIFEECITDYCAGESELCEWAVDAGYNAGYNAGLLDCDDDDDDDDDEFS